MRSGFNSRMKKVWGDLDGLVNGNDSLVPLVNLTFRFVAWAGVSFSFSIAVPPVLQNHRKEAA
jgi:hypothetical protein